MVDPREEERAWSIDQALRCPGVGAVVGDVEGMDMADSRRLQLAAEAGQTLGVLTRPAPEIRELSASGTRWVVSPQAGATDRVRWRVELRRCKAAALWAAASGGSVREWVLEWDERRRGVQVVGVDEVDVSGGVGAEVERETGGVRLAPDVAHRPGSPQVRRTA
jgi:protein ImuA